MIQQAAALHRTGRLKDAEALYRKILEAEPGHFDALHLLGVLCIQQGLCDQAIELIARAIGKRPSFPDAHANLGVALAESGRVGAALESYDRALRLKPGNAEAWCNRGNALARLGRHGDALDSHDKALALRPDYGNALEGRATALGRLHHHVEAAAGFSQALSLRPASVRALHGLGNALASLGRHAEAIACYDRAVAIRADDASLLANRANALAALHRYDDAIASYERALETEPQLPYAAGHVAFFRAHLCDWGQYDQSLVALAHEVRAGTLVSPFSLLALADDPALQHACAVAYARTRWPALAPLWTGRKYGHDRIRIAYLSGDFRDHPITHLAAGLFEQHDRKRFEITGISYGSGASDGVQKLLRPTFDRFLDLRTCGDREIAQRLSDDEIDIAVDLTGYTSAGRPGILAHRPAPVQVSYLGYLGTMGTQYIDYLIADDFVIPPEQRVHYCEKVVYLPGCFQVNGPRREMADRTPTRSEAGLPEQGFVFCSFNNTFKIRPPVFDVWMELLREVEDSVLWLLEADPVAARNLRKEAARRGVAPARLVYAPRVALSDHLARHRLADLFLDTLPVNAGATASDALWAGLPVITCAGRTFAGRMAGSLLRALGLAELITCSLQDYQAMALRLARDQPSLRRIRERLERSRLGTPLFDTDRFRRHIEAAYTTMWEKQQLGENPESFAVPAVTD